MNQFCSDTEFALSATLAVRNYFAHDFFIRHNDALSSDDTIKRPQPRLKRGKERFSFPPQSLQASLKASAKLSVFSSVTSLSGRTSNDSLRSNPLRGST